MNKNFRKISAYGLSALFVSLLVITACKKKTKDPEPGNTPPDNSTGLNEFLTGLVPISTTVPIDSPTLNGAPLSSWDEQTGNYCTTKKYKLGPVYNEGFILTPNNDVIYPGAILDGNSIYDGGYRLLSLPRSGGTISTDHIGAVNVSDNVTEVKKSTIQQGVANILNRVVSGSAGAQTNFEIIDVVSEKQLDVALGFSLGIAEKAKIKAGLNFSKAEKKSRLLVKFQQVYYTVTFDAKGRPSDYFQPTVNATDVYNTLNGTKVSPVYVSNVKYGRIAYYSISSELSQSELRASLNVQLNKVKLKAEVDATITTKLDNAKTEISGTIIGGSGSAAVGSILGLTQFYDYITQGGEYTAASPGLPIAYTLRRLSDNGVFAVQKTTEYTVSECKDIVGSLNISAMSHYFGGDEDEVRGSITMQIGYDDGSFSGGTTTLWNSTNRLFLPQNSTEVSLTNNPIIPIKYNPEKFSTAFILINVDLYNYADWQDQGVDAVDVSAEARKVATYKIYLRSIANTESLTNPWSSPANGTFSLKIDLPEAATYSNHCTDRSSTKACKSWANKYYYRQASVVDAKFTMNVQNPKF